MNGFRKGDKVVVVTADAQGVRPMTAAEEAAWYKHKILTCGPLDAAGEPHISTGFYYVTVPKGAILDVVKARTSARVGWVDRPGFCEVVCRETGEHFRIPRDAVRKV